MYPTQRHRRTIACLIAVTSMAACSKWKDRVEAAVTVDVQSDQTQLASMINAWLPAGWTGEQSIALSSVRVTHVRILGNEGNDGRRYEADVELLVDRTRTSPDVRGLPQGPVRLTFAGVVQHETRLRFMYAVPWIFSESHTHGTLIARNGVPISNDTGAFMYSPPPVTNPPVLAPGQSWTGSFANTMNMSDGQDSSARVYDVVNVPAQAGAHIRVEIVSQTPTRLGFLLLPPADVYPQVLAARVVPSSGTAQLQYVAPAAGALRLLVWKMNLDPAGSYTVRSLN